MHTDIYNAIKYPIMLFNSGYRATVGQFYEAN